MSYNQSRPDRCDSQQFRRTGQSTPAGYGRGAGAGAVTASSTNVDPSLSPNRSFKKRSNAQGWHQPRVVEPVTGGPANPSSGDIPKTLISSQSPTMNTSKAPGDPFKAFAFQFGSLGPDVMKTPPNLDEQKRAQVHTEIQQKVSFQGLPSHPMHQAQGTSMGAHIHPQLGHVGVGGSHHEHDSYPTTGKVMDSGGRSDRRSSNMVVDNRWAKIKNQGFHPAGYGGFRPGQGGNSGVVRNPRMQGPVMSRPMQHPRMGRTTPDLERWQRGSNFQQKGRFSSCMRVMHKAERKYQVGTIADEEEAKQRQLKGILNKLTPENFDKLLEQVKCVNIDNAITLTGVVSQIFDKALMEPTFVEMYADLCFHLSGALPDFNWYGEKFTFKRLLLNRCQEEFERGEVEEEKASGVAEEGQTEEEREEKRLKVRSRMLCNIRLIGELYKKRILTEKIMHACIQKLLGCDHDPHEENIEALCTLMSTIGVTIDHHKAKVHIDAYFERMELLSCNQELSSRTRFMLIDTIDLRKNKWQERMKVEGPILDTV